MKSIKVVTIGLLAISLASCSSMNKTQKGAVVGTAGGAATGAVIGRAAGNTALGSIIGGTVGGVAGAVIGRQMDKQAEEMERQMPDANVTRVEEGILLELSGEVLFGFDQANLTASAKQTLNELVGILNNYPDTDIEIQGHTDSKGSNKYNLRLSEQRAQTVESYLVQNGISNLRLSALGFGETSPRYSNESDSGRAQNRRVDFLVVANEKMKQEAMKEAGQ